MNINYKEAQFDFFPNTAGSPDEARRPHFMAARFNLTIENLVIFSIVSIMVVVFTFSLGVERGKKIALRDVTSPAQELKTQDASSQAVKMSADVKEVADESPKAAIDKGQVAAQVKKADAQLKDVAAPAAVQPVAVVQEQGGYTIQLASYKSQKSAQREAQVLQKRGYKAFVLPKGQHIVLCVGNFQTREDARMLGKKLKSNYQDYVVRRL